MKDEIEEKLWKIKVGKRERDRNSQNERNSEMQRRDGKWEGHA